jgi:hypothetical protein
VLTASRTNKRFPIPRWRSLEAEFASHGLASIAKAPAVASVTGPELTERLEHWRLRHGLVEAAELVETAIILGEDREAVGAARILLAAKSRVTSLVRRNAGLLMKRAGFGYEVNEEIKPISSTRIWRDYLRIHPRNALAWSELARIQLALGLANKSAERSMRIALNVAPFNRHVLRSAARLYVHLNEADRAFALIRNNEATPYDPWLLAAEVALAGQIDRPLPHYKQAVATLDAQIRPGQITELASALGTHFLRDGATKKSKRLFQQSTLAPNGNSLAQAEWASNFFGERLVEDKKLVQTKDSSEAWARRRYWDGNFVDALAHAMRWIDEEPISWMAYRGAAAAALMLEEYERAERLAECGLRHSPSSRELKLDLAFARASQDRLDEAETLFSSVDTSDDDNMGFIVEANRGLIALRRRQFDSGRQRYKDAIAGFRKKGLVENERLARAYFAREAARVGLEELDKLIKEAEPKRNEKLASNTARVLDQAKAIVAKRL